MLARFIGKSTTTPVGVYASTVSKRYSSIISVHRDTKEDNPNIAFEFNSENKKRAEEIIAKYPPQYKKGACMPLLDLGQRQLGFTSISVMNCCQVIRYATNESV